MMHIAFTIDNRFVRPCAVTMVSVLRNNVPYEIVFHVIGLNLHQEDVAFFSALCDSYGAKVFFSSFPQLFYPLMTRQFFCDFHEKSEDFCVS